MALAMTILRLLLSLLLSIVITFVLVAGYVLYPTIAMLIDAAHGPANSGASFAVGSIRLSNLLIIEVVIFAILVALLYRRRTNE